MIACRRSNASIEILDPSAKPDPELERVLHPLAAERGVAGFGNCIFATSAWMRLFCRASSHLLAFQPSFGESPDAGRGRRARIRNASSFV